jgi:colanic acid biosynthesis glycosyl transferase WcaI
MDMNPDQALAMNKVSARNPLVWAMRWLNRRIFARAANVVVLDRFMAERVERQYEVRGRMEILPPWPHAAAELSDKETRRQGDKENEVFGRVSLSPPLPVSLSNSNPDGRERPARNPFVEDHALEGRFVVMYSGNHSLASPVTTLVETALRMQDDPRFVFVFVGGGLGKRAVDEAIETHKPANILSLPYRPLERLHFSLSAADLHVVTLGNDMVGIIHPCKIYGAMAVGRPVLLIGPRPSHAADIIERHGIGWRVDQGDVEGLAAVLQQVAAMPRTDLAAMGERARHIAQQYYSKKNLCAEFCDIVERGMTSPVRRGEPARPHPVHGDSMRQTAPWKAQH